MAEISKLGRSLIKSSMTKPLNDTKYVHQAAQPLSDTKYVQQAAQPLNDPKYVHQAAHIRPSGHTWSRIKTSRLARVLSSPTGIGPVHPSPTGIGPVYPCRSMESRSSVEILNGEPKRSEVSSLSTATTYPRCPTTHLFVSSSSSGGREVYQEPTKKLEDMGKCQ